MSIIKSHDTILYGGNDEYKQLICKERRGKRGESGVYQFNRRKP